MSIFDDDWSSPSPQSNDRGEGSVVITTNSVPHTTLVIFENTTFQNNINKDIALLKNNLGFSNKLIDAVYELRNYVPNNAPPIWKDTLIPAMIRALVSDIHIANGVVEAIGRLRDVAIVIQQAERIVSQSRGSQDSITIASKQVPECLDAFKTCKKSLEGVNLDIVKVFTENSNQIFNIVGSEVVRGWAIQKESATKIISEQMGIISKIKSEQSELVGKIEGLMSYRYKLQERLGKEKIALEAEQKQIASDVADMRRRIKDSQSKIDSIPESITATETTSRRGGLFFWDWHRTETVTKQVKNPDRDSQVAYYDSLISKRLEVIKNLQNVSNVEKQKQAIAICEKEEADYAQLIKTAKEKLQNEYLSVEGPKFIAIKDAEIEIQKQRKAISDIEKSAEDTKKTMGLSGSTLIDCCIAVNSFSRADQSSGKVLQPLVSIMQNIISKVEINIKLLQTGKRDNVYLAGSCLKADFPFLVDTANALQEVTLPILEVSKKLELELNNTSN